MTTFSDIFKKAFLSTSTTEVTPLSIVIVMAMSIVVAAFIYLVYRRCYKGVLYSYHFNMSVALMTCITAMIVATISSNVVLSLGMVGALSIVRFRTAIKDPIDLIFLFWAVAAGIACGAKLYWMVVIGNLCVGLAFWVFSVSRKRKKAYLLVISFDNDVFPMVNEALSRFKYTVRSKVTRGDVTELTVELYLKDQNIQFTDKLAQINRVHNVSLVSYNGDFAAQ